MPKRVDRWSRMRIKPTLPPTREDLWNRARATERLWRRALADGAPVLVGIRNRPKPAREYLLDRWNLYTPHVYRVLGIDDDGVLDLYNGWGEDHPKRMAADQQPMTVDTLLHIGLTHDSFVTWTPG
jgi:hypothetical protein